MFLVETGDAYGLGDGYLALPFATVTGLAPVPQGRNTIDKTDSSLLRHGG